MGVWIRSQNGKSLREYFGLVKEVKELVKQKQSYEVLPF